MKTWEAFGGVGVSNCGTRRNGKPYNVLVTTKLVVMSKSDAAAMMKAHPQLKFHERERAEESEGEEKS